MCFDTVKTQVNIVVWSQFRHFWSYPLEDIIYEGIHDSHQYLGETELNFHYVLRDKFVHDVWDRCL